MTGESVGGTVDREPLAIDFTGTALGVLRKLKPYAFLLLVWDFVVRFQVVDPSTLPDPLTVGQTLLELSMSGQVLGPTTESLYRMAIAFVIAVGIGIPLGLLMGRFRPVRWFVEPLVSIAFPTPKIVFLPMFLIWFGFGSTPIILLAAIGGIFPILITTSAGAQGTPKELVWTARSVNMSRTWRLYRIVLPSALPDIFNGLQIGLFLTIVVTAVSEMVSSGSGLGHKIILAMDYYRISEALAFLLVIMFIGITANAVFVRIRARALRWTEDTTGG